MINEHFGAGVQVFLVEESRLPVRDRVDVTLWGDKYTFRQHHTERPPGSGLWFDRFSINYSDIREAQGQYRQIHRLAQPVTARVALPEPDGTRPELERKRSAPRSPATGEAGDRGAQDEA